PSRHPPFVRACPGPSPPSVSFREGEALPPPWTVAILATGSPSGCTTHPGGLELGWTKSCFSTSETPAGRGEGCGRVLSPHRRAPPGLARAGRGPGHRHPEPGGGAGGPARAEPVG